MRWSWGNFERGISRGAVGLGVAVSLGASPGGAAPVGFVTVASGLAQVQPAGGTGWKLAALDGQVSVGDSVRTEINSGIEILLVDDTLLTIGEDSEVVIDRMIVGGLATEERSILRQLRGQVRAQVGSAFGGTTRLEIHTPTAIVGVRGSTMNVRVQRASRGGGWVTLAAIQHGNGFVCGGGDCVDLGAGQLSEISQGARPGRPAAIPKGFDAPLERGLRAGRTVAKFQFDIDPHLGLGGRRGGDGGRRRAGAVRGSPDDGASGKVLARMSEQRMLTRQSLNLANGVSQNVGASEVLNRLGDGGLGAMPRLGSDVRGQPLQALLNSLESRGGLSAGATP